jgi:hypothetical protein
MSIEIINDKVQWDRLVDESPNSLLFHKWDFLKLVEKHTGYELFPYGIFQGQEPIAVIPIFYIRKKGLKFAYSPPQATLSYIPYMGFAFSKAYGELRQREKEGYLLYMLQELEKVLSHLSPNYVSLALEPGDVDARPYQMNGYEALLQYTYLIGLERPLEDIWDTFDSSCKKTIKDAAKLNPSVERANDSKVLFDMMRERLAFNEKTFFHAQSHEYLKDIMSAFPDNLKMYFVYVDGELAGASLNYGYRKRCIGWMGAPATKKHMGVNEYMIWDLIKKAKEEGFSELENLGADEKRLNPFKSKFGPSLLPYYYMVKRDALYRAANNTSEMLTRMIAGLNASRTPAHVTE